MSGPPNRSAPPPNLAELRRRIDALDRKIVALLARSLRLIDGAARLKQTRQEIRDEARIEEVLGKVAEEAGRLGADRAIVRRVYSCLIEASIEREFTQFDREKRA